MVPHSILSGKSLFSHENKYLHEARPGISCGIPTQVYMTRVILHNSRLSCELPYLDPCTIHVNDYQHDKPQIQSRW